ncbi:proprotein convertase subtilisin/kexin type 1 inhibitor, like [Osmerus mordax]|uniref:proprotein convertase subtilisin/kexin type 1 inhibitor, like n=1 Tax=Osmerus mordax TaxID=8014 RepID=UPI003510BC22
MMGPLTSCTLLVLSLTLLHTHAIQAKSLSAGHSAGRAQDRTGNHRSRRDLRDLLPYEAQMMSDPAAFEGRGRGKELYYQPDEWRRQGMGQALQRLVESDQRREQEAAYLAGMLRLLNEVEGGDRGMEEEQEEGPGDFPYPPDYDETDQGMSMGKPQASWQGLLDPQLTQALLERYRQERMLQAGLQVPDSDKQNRDQETLRYLVAKILSSISPSNPQSPSGRRARRDLVAVEGGARPASPVHKRSRRSLDDAAPTSLSQDAPLLRVKRLGDEEGGEGGAGVEGGYRPPPQGLQRMKRVDPELPSGRSRRRRRALTYDPDLLVQHILQYMPQ